MGLMGCDTVGTDGVTGVAILCDDCEEDGV